MILLDANLLLYAYDVRSPHHSAAKLWLERAFDAEQPIGLPWQTISAFIRISTNPKLNPDAPSLAAVLQVVNEWLTRSNVAILQPGPRYWFILQETLLAGQAGGNLVTDAQLAALAIECGAALASSDRDFSRFEKLRWINPLEIMHSR